MAYMSQENKAKIVKVAKEILKKYNVKGTFAVRNHSTLICNIKSSPLDFIGNMNKVLEDDIVSINFFTLATNYISVNPYHYKDHFSGECLDFLNELIPAMNAGNWDKSDISTDYFDVGWYIDVNIGNWNKPYVLTK